MSSSKETNPKDAIAGTKLPLGLLSHIAKAYWAVAQYAGMIKYGAWNWRRAGVRSSVYTSAARRHLDAYDSGEEHDPVDGTHHLGNAMACCAIILDARAAGKLTDDRPPSVNIRPTYAECEATMATLRAKYSDANPRHYDIRDTEPKPPVTLRGDTREQGEASLIPGARNAVYGSIKDDSDVHYFGSGVGKGITPPAPQAMYVLTEDDEPGPASSGYVPNPPSGAV